jgi:hypothetical protein
MGGGNSAASAGGAGTGSDPSAASSDADASAPTDSAPADDVSASPDSSSPGAGPSTGPTGAAGPSADCGNLTGKTWQTANETNFESYPAPGSAECVQYSGCKYEGLFAACSGKKSEAWVKAHNIVSVFPSGSLERHDLCLKDRSGKTIRVTAVDTCADTDCGGCCTQNRGKAALLVDVEKYTYQRFNGTDGPIMWTDLGPNPNACN